MKDAFACSYRAQWLQFRMVGTCGVSNSQGPLLVCQQLPDRLNVVGESCCST